MPDLSAPTTGAPTVWWTGRLLLAGIVATGAVGSWAATYEPTPVSGAAATAWAPPSTTASPAPGTGQDVGVGYGNVTALAADAPDPGTSTREQSATATARAAERERRLARQARRADRELAAFVEASNQLRAQAQAEVQAAAGAAAATAQSARTAPSQGLTNAPTGTWVAPIQGSYRITATFGQSGSRWSRNHTGLDFAAPSGTPVHVVAAGQVTETGDAGAYGNKVEVTHADGTRTWYCHLSRIDVTEGQSLAAGAQLGAVGSTGNSTGPHLHLEVRPSGGSAIDPRQALAARGVAV